MHYLLDTNAFLFWISDSPKLSAHARKTIAASTNEMLLSSISAWEIVTKWQLGKLKLPDDPHRLVPKRMLLHRIRELPFATEHALRIANLPMHHGDPFDRAIIAQALANKLVVITSDERFEAYGVRIIA